MKPIRKLIVGVDVVREEDGSHALSPGTRTAVRQAVWLAERTGGRIELLHSTFRHAEDSAPPVSRGDEKLESELHELGAVAPLAQPLEFTEERPWAALSAALESGRADLVVVAKRNHAKRTDRRLGSVSMKLIRHAPGPVWIIRPDHPQHHRWILAATDLSPVGDLAVEYGAFFAAADDCRLAVVHAWQRPLELQFASSRMPEAELQAHLEAIPEAARKQVEAIPGVSELEERVKISLTCDAPSHAIRAAVRRIDPDLLVMGSLSRSGVAGALIGNTAEKVLYRVDCSLFIVMPE